MSQENVDVVRELLESFDARSHSYAFEVYDPDIEWDASRHPAIDLARVYRGHEGVREFWRGWLSAWETISFEIVDLVDAGDDVAAFIHQRNRGRATGIEVDVAPYALVFTFRQGKVIRWCIYSDIDEALEAVGLSQQDAPADSS